MPKNPEPINAMSSNKKTPVQSHLPEARQRVWG